MTSQTVNNHAKTCYTNFEFALNHVRVALDEITKLTKTLNRSGGNADRFQGWQVPSRDDVQAATRKCSMELDGLRAASTTYKAELIARGWRV